ncbi:MAG: guanylate kinase [Pseudomonadales bacterium]|nr:guanylate kinase [Pseudomonadales bacterium]
MNNPPAKLFVLAAPSGAGKTSLVKALVNANGDVDVAISHTTRQPREGETNGINYHFISRTEFNQLEQDGGFLETAEVFGNRYGTSKQAVDQTLANGNNLILEIDWQGAQQIRKSMPAAETIFILPPSISSLTERLTGRGQDNNSTINFRMAQAINEISHYNEFDYIIVNDDFDIALQQLEQVIRAGAVELTQMRQKQLLMPLLANLLPDQPL